MGGYCPMCICPGYLTGVFDRGYCPDTSINMIGKLRTGRI